MQSTTRSGEAITVATGVAMALCLALAGCGGETCGDGCTEGLRCSSTLDASDDGELADALEEAEAGSCIALAPGTYGAVTLPTGVSLVGPGDAKATVGTVVVPAGTGATVRGLHVAGVVKLEPDASDVHLEHLLVTGSKNGVQAEARASFTLADSTLRGVPDNAVLAVDAARVTIQRTLIEDTGGPGVWVQCGKGCACPDPPTVELDAVTLRHNALVGVLLVGSTATLGSVEITDTQPGPDFAGGGGLAASACSTVNAKGLTIQGSTAYGMLLDDSSGSLGTAGDDVGIIIINSKGGGLFLENVGPGKSVKVDNATLGSNSGIGLDIGGGSQGIIIINSRIEKTGLKSMESEGWVPDNDTKTPVGSANIGDALIWSAAAKAEIDGLTLSGSARNALLIDGAVAPGSTLANVTLEGGDDAKGILQQHVMQPTDAPQTTNAPAVTQQVDAVSDTPVAPKAPKAL